MKRVPTWLTVSNLKLDADLKRRHDAETSIEWEWHLDPDFECGLTHLDLEHLRDVAVRKGMGDDETRRIAWPIVLGIGLEPGERRDAGEYVDRAAYIEAARQLLDGGGGASSSRGGAGGGGDNSDDSALERPGRAPNDAATIEADVQRSLWAFTEGWSEARRQQLRESLRRVVAGSVHAQHGANPGCINYLQGFHSVAGGGARGAQRRGARRGGDGTPGALPPPRQHAILPGQPAGRHGARLAVASAEPTRNCTTRFFTSTTSRRTSASSG
jgi:hypothetical protein